MNKKVIFGLAFILVALLAIIGGTTYAWLTDTDSKSFTYTVGQVSYTVDGTANNAVIVPGDSIIPTVTITNGSNVDTNIRVKVSATTTGTLPAGATATFAEYDADLKNEKDLFLVTKATDWVLADGYYYYGAVSGAESVITSATTSVATPFSSIILNGWVAGNTFEGKTVTITLTFEVKQAANVEWSEMGSINFESGLPTA